MIDKGNKYLKGFAVAGASLVAAKIGFAATVKWDSGGSDSKWETALNWDTDSLPTSADTAYISDGGTAGFDAVSDTASVSRLYVGYTGDGTLSVSGGSLKATQTGSNTVFLVGNGAIGTLNVSGGELDVGHRAQIGAGANGQGTVKLSGGSFIVSRGGNSQIDTSFGSTSLDLGVAASGSSGLLEVSGGVFKTRVGAVIGPNGTFKVEGSGATEIGIGSHGSVDGFWLQKAGGVLQVRVDSDGVTPIFVDDVGDDGAGLQGNVKFESGALLDVSHISTAVDGTFTVMEWEGSVTDEGLAFAPGVDTSIWSFAIDEAAKKLTVTAVGSPVTQLFWENSLSDNDFAKAENWDLDKSFAGMNLIVDRAGSDKAVLGTDLADNLMALRIGYQIGDGEFEQSAGSFKATQNSSAYSRVGGNGYTGTWRMKGGAATINTIHLGLSGGTGNLVIEDGAMDIARSAGDYSLQVGNGGIGNFEISDGRIRTRAGVRVSGTGTFTVNGSAPTAVAIGSYNNVDGRWVQETGGVLKIGIDESATGVTPIFVDETDGTPGNSWDGNVTFEAGSLLDVSFLGAENYGTFTVMEWEGELVDNGLEFAPHVDRMRWSFDLDEANKRLTVTARASDAPRTALTVNTIEDFQAAAGLDHHEITLAPGEYWLVGDKSLRGAEFAPLLNLSGFNTHYNLEGVTLNVSTEDLAGYGNRTIVFVVQVSGDNCTVEGLTLKMVHTSIKGTDTWGYERQWTADKSSVVVCVTGSNTVIRDWDVTTGGSYPYGFGDAFGKGSRPNSGGVTNAAFISHKKQSGFLITHGADNVLVEDVTLNMRSFGHGFFLQGGASNIVFRRCQAIGDEMADSDDIIAHPVYQEWGFATYKEPIPSGIKISKHEGGFRWYGNSDSGSNGWPEQSSNVLIEDCRVERMRTGVAPGYGEGFLHVKNMEAYDCEFGFATSAGADDILFENCKGNAVNGPLVYFQYGADNAVMDIELTGDKPANGVWPIALIGGDNNHVTITSSALPRMYPKEAYVNVSQTWREWRHRPSPDPDASGSNYSKAARNNTILNYTDQIMVFGKNATDNVGCVSLGGVINKGRNNEYVGTTLVPEQITVIDTWSSPNNPMDVPWAQWDSQGNQILPTPPYEVFSGHQLVDEALALGGSSDEDEGTIVSSGATLEVASGFALQNETISISGSGIDGKGAIYSEGAVGTSTRLNSSSGRITLDGDATIGVGVEGNQLLVGRIDGAGVLTKSGPGQLTMEGNSNLFEGTFVVAEGVVRARPNKANMDLRIEPGALLGQSGNAAVNQKADKSATVDGTLDLNARGVADGNSLSASVGSLHGSGLITSTSEAAVQSLNVLSGGSFEGSIEGRIALVKRGAGSELVLGGANTHTGLTSVLEGKLSVDGSISSSSAVILDTGAALGGSGTIASPVEAKAGSALAAGSSIGGLTLGSLSLAAGAVLEVEMDDAQGLAGSTGWDLLVVQGAVSYLAGPGSIVVKLSSLQGSVANFDGSSDSSWVILQAGSGVSSLAGAGFSIEVTDVPGSENGLFSVHVSETELRLVYEVDTDGDGVADNADAFPADPTEWVDSDGDGTGDNSDAFPSDPTEWSDNDGDLVGDNADLDDDNDGVADGEDAFPFDASEWSDLDGDGLGDNADTDDDGDGVADDIDNCPITPNAAQIDLNGDGYGDLCVASNVNIDESVVILYAPLIGSGVEIHKDVVIGDFAQIANDVAIHKEVIIGNNFSVGVGSKVKKSVSLGNDVFIGEGVDIDKETVVEDEVVIGDDVVIKSGVHIGLGARIGSGVRIGHSVTIGAGVVIEDGAEIEDGARVD
ncbi:thrombospondin type 3 repeat-containing protein [Pelagicoccus enzymogenes]|uniref:thrombospondin type 3 repeat-containing protein n=1 Tax=Pelagicoccus enzymogenes TaxID=2773457 RepID=UPI00280F35FA|nr:thrombospondin type 3 repeat-containing protein [Pelagicoccus enzymogenes]MDQ8197862.1 thrombospondin type 3 repeat-containing protein [Pelagicoccus enzymogenes]